MGIPSSRCDAPRASVAAVHSALRGGRAYGRLIQTQPVLHVDMGKVWLRFARRKRLWSPERFCAYVADSWQRADAPAVAIPVPLPIVPYTTASGGLPRRHDTVCGG